MWQLLAKVGCGRQVARVIIRVNDLLVPPDSLGKELA